MQPAAGLPRRHAIWARRPPALRPLREHEHAAHDVRRLHRVRPAPAAAGRVRHRTSRRRRRRVSKDAASAAYAAAYAAGVMSPAVYAAQHAAKRSDPKVKRGPLEPPALAVEYVQTSLSLADNAHAAVDSSDASELSQAVGVRAARPHNRKGSGGQLV